MLSFVGVSSLMIASNVIRLLVSALVPLTTEAMGSILAVAILFALFCTFIINAFSSIADDSPRPWLWVCCGGVLLGLFFLYLIPYSLPDWLFGDGWGTVRGVFEAAYALLLTFGCQAPTTEAIETLNAIMDQSSDVASMLLMMYSFALVLLCYALPILFAFAVVAQFRAILCDWQLIHRRAKHKEVLLLSGLDDTCIAMAESVFERIKADEDFAAPLVVFCEVDDSERDDKTSLIERLEREGNRHLIITPRNCIDAMTTIDEGTLFPFRTVRNAVSRYRFLFFSKDYSSNVVNSIDALDHIVQRALKEGDDEAIGDKKAYASRFSVFCLHNNQENELVFDSLVYGSDQNDTGLTNIEKVIRRAIEVRLLSRAQEQAFDLFTRHPLFDVLDRPCYESNDELADDYACDYRIAPNQNATEEAAAQPELSSKVHRQQLYVLVLGLGAYGTEILKTAYWIGRMHNVDLHIWGVDINGGAIEQLLRETCPSMMDEEINGEPLVSIYETGVFTENLELELRKLPDGARVYAVITLGDDQLNLNVALWLRRLFEDMRLEGKSFGARDKDGIWHGLPMILPLINSSEIASAAARLNASQKDKEGELRVGAFALTSFGETREIFSYQNIIIAPWEKRALAMNAAYREVWDDVSGIKGIDAKMPKGEIIDEYAEFEIKKLSNRTNVRHIPYKLWCLGIDPHYYLDSDGNLDHTIDHTWWQDLLMLDPDGSQQLMSQQMGSQDVMKKALDKLRKSHPAVCALGDLEHERWMAFYFSQGWRDMSVEECERLVDCGIVSARSVHQSPKLRRHCYLCPTEELLERGADLGDDPYAYDRASVVEIPRILDESIFK